MIPFVIECDLKRNQALRTSGEQRELMHVTSAEHYSLHGLIFYSVLSFLFTFFWSNSSSLSFFFFFFFLTSFCCSNSISSDKS